MLRLIPKAAPMAARMPLIIMMAIPTITAMVTGMIMTEKHDWHSDPITKETVIDAGYRNTQNVRRFFRAAIGERFRFDRPFMAWMKDNRGATMSDAVAEWLRREAAK